MNAGLIVIILLLVLSILGIPIYLALGIGTLVALNMADMPFIVLPQKLFAGNLVHQLTAGNPVLYAGREYYVSQYYREAD